MTRAVRIKFIKHFLLYSLLLIDLGGTTALAQSGNLQIELTVEEQAWLKAHKTIRIGSDIAYPPFEFRDDNGVYRGIAFDYIDYINDLLGIEMRVVPGLSWSAVLDGIKNGKIDVISAAVSTNERRKFINFTKPYASFPPVIITRKDFPPVDDLADFNGKIVAMVKGYFYVDEVTRNYPDIKPLFVETALDALNAVVGGKADAIVVNLGVGAYLIHEHSLLSLKVASKAEINSGSVSFGIRKDWYVFATILEKARNAIPTQIHQNIINKWVPAEISEEVEAANNELTTEVGLAEAKFSVNNFIVAILVIAVVVLVIISLFRQMGHRLGDKLLVGQNLPWLITGLVSLFLVVVMIVAWQALERMERNLRDDQGEQLATLNHSVKESLKLWRKSRGRELHHLTDDIRLLPAAEALLEVPRNRDALLKSDALSESRNVYNYHNKDIGALGYFIIAPDGMSLASSRDVNVGSHNLIMEQQPALMKRVFAGEHVFVQPIYSDVPLKDALGQRVEKAATMFFASPLRDESGKVIAALTLRFDPVEELSFVSRIGRVGDSGETYAFDRNARLLTASRFNKKLDAFSKAFGDRQKLLSMQLRDPGGDLSEGYRPENARANWPLTLMAKEAIVGHDGFEVDGYRDYRGAHVLGAWSWSEELGIGLATEIDEVEAMGSYHDMKRWVLGVLSGIAFISLLLTAFSVWIGERARSRLNVLVDERTNELKEAEGRSSLLLESVGEGIFGVDVNGHLTFINQAGAEMLGFTSDEMVGKRVHSLMHHTRADGSDYPEEECLMYQSFTEGVKGTRDDEVLWRKDGSSFPVLFNSVPIMDAEDELVGAVIVFLDITLRITAEVELQEKFDDLERFRKMAVGRELKMIELKKEINQHLQEQGKSEKYKISKY